MVWIILRWSNLTKKKSNGLGNNQQLQYIFWESENPPGFPLLRIFWPPKNPNEVPTKNSHIEAAGKTGGLVKIINLQVFRRSFLWWNQKGAKKNPSFSIQKKVYVKITTPCSGFSYCSEIRYKKKHLGCTSILNNEINYQLQLVNAGFQSSTIGLNPCKGPITVLPRFPHLDHFQHDFITSWETEIILLKVRKILANRRQSD